MKDWWQCTFPKGRQSLIISDGDGYPVQIAYGEVGTGKPLVLLHGMGSWSYNWRNCIAPLSKYFRVICFDAKGYGFSEKPGFRREKNGHQVIELERILQALCAEPAVIIAESLGGLVALALAQQKPELIARLIVINVPIFADRLPHWSMWILSQTPRELLQTVDDLRLAFLFTPLFREVMAMERRGVLFNPAILTEEDVYWITYPFIEFPGTILKVAEDLQLAAAEIKNYELNQPNMLSTIQNNLGAIQSPTLIMWGDKDSWFPTSHGERLHKSIPLSQLKIIKDCYHDASIGSSQVVSAAIIDFLQETNF